MSHARSRSTPAVAGGLRRRRLLGASAATAAWAAAGLVAPGPAPAQPAPARPPAVPPDGSRMALLVGNRDYPAGQDLPSMHTNARRAGEALGRLGFEVTTLVDLDRAQCLAAVDSFATRMAALPRGGVAVFYFCGHGMQDDAENYLLPARLYPRNRQTEDAKKLYIALRADVIAKLPRRPDGLNITVIDACRTSPKVLAPQDALNQMLAPDGDLIVFSTAAGKPALAPIDENRLTFFTDALVRQLERQATTPEELSFRELFRLVKEDTFQTMRAHPVEDIRELAQVPYIADRTGKPVRVAPLALTPPPPASAADTRAAEEAAFAAMGNTLWPGDVLRLAAEFSTRFPASRFASAASVARAGASAAQRVLFPPPATDGRRVERIGLQRRDFQPRADLGEAFNEDLRRAARGDQDAAAQVAQRLKPAETTGPLALRYEEWMKFAAELGNGIAAFDLSRHFDAMKLSSESARWEARARALGYNPPANLRDTR